MDAESMRLFGIIFTGISALSALFILVNSDLFLVKVLGVSCFAGTAGAIYSVGEMTKKIYEEKE